MPSNSFNLGSKDVLNILIVDVASKRHNLSLCQKAEFFDGQTHIKVLHVFLYCCIEVLALGANIVTTAEQLYQSIV